MGWGGFSIGALRLLEQSTKHRELERSCKFYGLTHDVGLGVYAWWKMIPIIQIIQSDFYKKENSVIWHAPVRYRPDKQYDTIMADLYHRAINHRVSDQNITSSKDKESFDDLIHSEYESFVGREYAKSIIYRSLLGYKSTLHYHRRHFARYVHDAFNLYQYPNETLQKLYDIIPDIQNHNTLESSLYRFDTCREDKEYFEYFKRVSKWSSRTIANESDLSKMCLEYYISVKRHVASNISSTISAVVDSIYL